MRAWILIACCCVVSAPALATTFAPLSFEQLVDASSMIVYGRVTAVRSQWTDDRRYIESTVSLEVISGMKGRVTDTISFVVPGGQVGRYLNVIPGAPVFAPGDLAVVFLTARGARLPITTGLTQGVYRVQRDGAGQVRVSAPAVGPDGRIVRGDVNRKLMSLPAFETTVRSVSAR